MDNEAPAPEPEAADVDVEAELPEDQDSFPREYVEKLRNENAKWRTQYRELDSHFEGYSPQERQRYLELVTNLRDSPETALEEFRGVTERLAKQLGKEPWTVSDETPEAAEPAPEPAADEPITEDRIAALVEERLAAERESAERESRVQKTYAEAEALSDDYKTPGGKAFLFGVAQELQQNLGRDVTLAEAHGVISELAEARTQSAIDEALESVRSGKAYPPRLPAGDPAAGEAKGPPTTLEEAKARAQETLRAGGLTR